MNITPDQVETFTWGEVVAVHTIGPYDVIEYISKQGGKAYHPYINGVDSGHYESTLDEAIITAIALRWDGLNTRASEYFARMVNIGLDETKQYRADV